LVPFEAVAAFLAGGGGGAFVVLLDFVFEGADGVLKGGGFSSREDPVTVADC
jgi:hypothetical protein